MNQLEVFFCQNIVSFRCNIESLKSATTTMSGRGVGPSKYCFSNGIYLFIELLEVYLLFIKLVL